MKYVISILLCISLNAWSAKLSWENGTQDRANWSILTKATIKDFYKSFNSAKDAERFCSSYSTLTKDERILMWSELISAIAFYESGWKPTSRMREPGMGTDQVTGKPVYSEGLLQMSYQDTLWAKYCMFDWENDKYLSPKDPNKTILNPFINLDCGIQVLAAQIRRTGKVIMPRGKCYWAVICDGHKYQKIKEITAMTNKFCKGE